MNYDEAHAAFFIDESVKHDQALVKERYREGEIPCDGLVQTKKDALHAVTYYLWLYQELVSRTRVNDNRVSDKTKDCFKRTINKYLGMVME